MNKEIIAEKTKVIGSAGLARYALEHLDKIKQGYTVDFCGDSERESMRFGIAFCDTSFMKFDSIYDVLIVDYYGGSPDTRLYTVNAEEVNDIELDVICLAEVIDDVVECDCGKFRKDEEIIVELVWRNDEVEA